MADHEQDETALITQAQAGDLDAFNDLVLRYQNFIYSVTYRIMGDSESASDATQDTFLTAYRRLETFRGGNFRAWLARIGTNTCYDELRRRKRRPADYIEDLPGSESADGPPLPSEAPTPEHVAGQTELQQAIQDCINALQEDRRLVLVMREIEGLSYEEIADTLTIQVGTVKSRLSRARQAMRHCLQAVQELLPPEFRLKE